MAVVEDINYHRLVLQNWIDLFSSLPKEEISKCNQGEDVVWLKTKSQFPLLNSIFNFNCDYMNFSERLKQAKQYFSTVPFTWWHLADSEPNLQVAQILDSEQFVSAGSYKGISLDLENALLPQTDNPNITVKLVENTTQHKIFIDILADVFQLTDRIKQDFDKLLNAKTSAGKLCNYLGFYQDKPVSVLSAFINTGVVGLYNGATLADFCKRGVCSAVTAMALRQAKQQGAHHAVAQLMAQDKAGRITEQLGFETVCRFIPYIYGTNAASLEPI